MPNPGDAAKRLIDLVGASAGLVVLGPILATIAVLVRLVDGRPVLHRSVRAGRNELPFTLLKVRTMTERRAPDGSLLPDAERVTHLGRFLRSTSLDELPQLWNVLRGDMSLVGPRPLPMSYLPRYSDREARRHEIRPGLTGWAQVHGRNQIDWDERLELDVWYVEHRTLARDVSILVRTVFQVLRRTGISADGEATMRELRPEHDATT